MLCIQSDEVIKELVEEWVVASMKHALGDNLTEDVLGDGVAGDQDGEAKRVVEGSADDAEDEIGAALLVTAVVQVLNVGAVCGDGPETRHLDEVLSLDVCLWYHVGQQEENSLVLIGAHPLLNPLAEPGLVVRRPVLFCILKK